jgi:hypothetical protein
MFKRLFSRSDAGRLRSVTDPVLGELRLSEDSEWWEGNITLNGVPIGFKIGGAGGPDPRLIEHAHGIVQSFAEFETMVRAFLEKEGKEVKCLRPFVEEIRQLRIEDICLFWPKRPHDGMIYFRGLDKYRVWRCDYVNHKPKGLGFDS